MHSNHHQCLTRKAPIACVHRAALARDPLTYVIPKDLPRRARRTYPTAARVDWSRSWHCLRAARFCASRLLTGSLRRVNACQLRTLGGSDTGSTALNRLDVHKNVSNSPDAFRDNLDEHDACLDALRADPTATFLSYLPHSGLHNQRIALENAITLARILNRTLLVPPARLGPSPLRYVRSSSLIRALSLDDKKGLFHCASMPADVPPPDECADYFTHTLVPWSSLVDLTPITIHQPLIRVSNLSAAWMEERLGVQLRDIFALLDTDPYEFHFVDTPDSARAGDKYLHPVPIEMLAASTKRLIQLGTLFGSSRLRLRLEEHRRIRGEVRRNMLFSSAELTLAADGIGGALGEVYLGAHVRIGDGRFQTSAQANVRLVWWKLVHQVLGIDRQTALSLEKQVLSDTITVRASGHSNEDSYANDDDDDDVVRDEIEGLVPPKMPVDRPSQRVPHPPLPPLPKTFSPKTPCRARLHTRRSLLRLNVPLFIATDAQDPLTDPVLAPVLATFPCTFFLSSFVGETVHLEGLTNGYDGVHLAGFVAPIVDALVLGRAWAVVGTEGSTFSRYVLDVLWRAYHGWEIVQRG